ncbi:MAG: glycoside hydrolase [Treponema sp.]|jgi:spore germination protein YaaH|nr:glycoside hydrolase [Treponema sp.]
MKGLQGSKNSRWLWCFFVALLVIGFPACQSEPVHPEVEQKPDVADEDIQIEEYTVEESPETALRVPASEEEAAAEKAPEEEPEEEPGGVSSFGEIWGYLISGKEDAFTKEAPLTDIGYFGAEVDSYGQLVNVPNPKAIPRFSGRIHLVVGCTGRALSHFVLMEGSPVRKQLIADLLEKAKPFDGLQIDFEDVPPRDRDTFHSFLAELRKGLGNKRFTIALRARLRTLDNDVYDYERIKPLVDRILVMAYDEHWATSEPGPIASMDWCKAVASYSLKTIGPEKLIMGLPFYGRTWGSSNLFRAFHFSGIERIKQEHQVTEVRREQGIPTFTYEVPVRVTAYYEDEQSLSLRMKMYRTLGVQSIGFWALGQESPRIWKLLSLKKD